MGLLEVGHSSSGSMIHALCMGVRRIFPKLVASHDQWALNWVKNICPFTAYFALHDAKICIQCKSRKFCKPAHLEISFSFFCIILLIVIVTFALKTFLITIDRRFRDKLIHLTYRSVVIRMQWTCECDAIHETQAPVVRGIAAGPSESTGKSTGCESHTKQRKMAIIMFSVS